MKIRPRAMLAATLALCAGLLATAAFAAEPIQATLTVTQEAAGPRIEPEVYGHFTEHLGSGVYGGLWVGPESDIANTRGWRNDVVDALRRLQVPVLRWPGGCFADDYDWRDGIGAPDKRPARLNKVWGNVIEPNRVGTHEYMDLIEQLGADAYIAGNMGSMPPRAMAQWIEYLSSDSQSDLAEERRRNGRDKPWKVKYFGVGNESWGCGGNMRPEYQSDLHNQYAAFLHTQSLRVASGDGTANDHLTEVMMARSAKYMDALTLHHYAMPNGWQTKGAATGFDAATWARTMRAAMAMEERIATTTRIMDKYDTGKRVKLYVDEWGTWHDPEPGTNAGFLVQQNTLRDAMVAALTFNVFHRHTERVKMANIAQMVNALQAVVLTDGPRMLLTPTYHTFDLYKPFRSATPLKATLRAPRWRQGKVELPIVDVSVARAADGSTVLALVNLDPQRSVRVVTNLKGAARGRLLTAAQMDAHNTFARPNALMPVAYAAGKGAAPLALDLPPKSIIVVTVKP